MPMKSKEHRKFQNTKWESTQMETRRFVASRSVAQDVKKRGWPLASSAVRVVLAILALSA